MPTLQEINAVRQSLGDSPLKSIGTPVTSNQNTSLIDKLGLRESLPKEESPQPGFFSRVATDYQQAIPNLAAEAGRNDESTSQNPIIRTGENALAATASGINTVFSPITQGVKSFSDALSNTDTAQHIAQNPVVGKVLDFFSNKGQQLDDWAQKHPEAARNLQNALVVGSTALGGKAEPAINTASVNAAKGAAETAINVVDKTVPVVKNAASKAVDIAQNTPVLNKVLPATEESKVLKTIRAIDPDTELSEKQLAKRYKEVATKGVDGKPSSVFSEQKLSPNEQVRDLAIRLKDDIKHSDPFKNLKSLNKSLQKTEVEIQNILDGDPSMVYNLDKQSLATKLQDLKSKSPREFGRIKESKATFDDVIDFGIDTLSKAEDTMKGGRDARIAFDTQAKLEYPSAFKDGLIDTKTPAGNAIKLVRDMYNEHLYNLSPDGSKLRQLISKEADIYRASEFLSRKAAKKHGTTSFMQWAKSNPVKAGILGGAAGAVLTPIGYKVVKAATE